MPTNEERREIARRLRGDPYNTIIPYRTGIHFGMGCHEAANRFWDICERIRSAGDYDIAYSTRSVLADLIEPDYTSEESEYFILPKPKDPLICQYSSVDGSVYDIINENVREWQKQIDKDIQQRLFETFRKTCHDTDRMGDAIKCSECGEVTRETLYWVDVDEAGRTVKRRRPLFCARCGAKVISDASF